MPEDHKTTLAIANAAIMVGDFEGFLNLCTEDTVWNFVGDIDPAGARGPSRVYP